MCLLNTKYEEGSVDSETGKLIKDINKDEEIFGNYGNSSQNKIIINVVKNYGEKFGWEIDVDFPSWGNTEIYVNTISKGYLLPVKPKDIGEQQECSKIRKTSTTTKFF